MVQVSSSVVLIVQIAVVVVCIGTVASSPPFMFSLPRARPVGNPAFCKGDGQLCFSYDLAQIVGPEYWASVCDTLNCFYGNNQSPIWINPYEVQFMCGAILRYAANPRIEGKMKNAGVYPTAGEFSQQAKLVNVPGFDNTAFILERLDIHFKGGPFNRGAEHIIWTSDYDAEMHLVHRRENVDKDEQNLVEAGRAIVAVFLSTQRGRPSEDLNAILDKIGSIVEYKLKRCREYFDNRCPRVVSEKYFESSSETEEDDDQISSAISMSNLFRKRYSGNGDNGDDEDKSERVNRRGRRDRRRKEKGDETEGKEKGDKKVGKEKGDKKEGNEKGDKKEGKEKEDKNEGREKEGKKEGEDQVEFCKEYFSRPLRCVSGDDDDDDGDEEICDTDKCPDSTDDCVGGDCTVKIEFNPENLLPTRRDFYYYYGSLTSPALSEVVAWQVMDEPIKITSYQLWVLQQMESWEKGVPISLYGNVRPPQALNGRQVYANFCGGVITK